MSQTQTQDDGDSESTEQELGSIVGPSEEIEAIVRNTSLASGSEPLHDEVYLSIQNGVVNTIARTGSAMSYCTYTDSSNLHSIETAVEGGVEAVIQVTKYLSYQGFASDGDTAKLSFRGNPEDRLANVAEFTGSLNSRIMLPSSPRLVNEVPTGLPERFNEDDRLVSQVGDPLPTVIKTDTDQIRRIIEVTEYDPEVTFYPITVEDGEFVLSVGVEDGRDGVWGELETRGIETDGEDVHNHYLKGFEPAFKTLNGSVTLQTINASDREDGQKAQAGPLVIVQDEYNGTVIRHVIGNVDGN